MTDNIAFTYNARSTPPAATSVATDDVSGVHFQKIKIDIGGDGVSVPLTADGVSRAIPTIDYAHHEIHAGSSFVYSGAFDLSISNVIDVRITTPNTDKWAHFLLEFSTEVAYQWAFYEGATITNTGTAYVPTNMNRNSTGVAGVAIDYISNTSLANANLDTGIGAATIILQGFTGSGRTGGSSSLREEIILKKNTI